MTRDEATELAKRIINCWRGGPPLAEWIEELLPLDNGMASTTFVRLRRTLEHAPSVARFLAEYRGVRGPTVDVVSRKHDEQTITLGEYMARLSHRAANGNKEAAAEFALWERHLNGQCKWTTRRRPHLELVE